VPRCIICDASDFQNGLYTYSEHRKGRLKFELTPDGYLCSRCARSIESASRASVVIKKDEGEITFITEDDFDEVLPNELDVSHDDDDNEQRVSVTESS
jgi:hypothetical protein